MALHRIVGLVRELTTPIELEPLAPANEESLSSQPPPPPSPTAISPTTGELKRTLWPRNTPCAVIERASCPDQRVIRTTLEHVAEAIESEGSRPPGLLVVGHACEVLYTREKGRAWAVEEGFRGLEIDDLIPGGLERLQDVVTA